MKIRVTKTTKVGIGGGLTFIENLKKAIMPFGHELVDDGDYDILLIAGATLCDRETVDAAKNSGKPIILRVDNILEDSKNRNTGMTRMVEFADKADVIVYQSEWAKNLLSPLCGDGMVIYNGVDTDIFFPAEDRQESNNIRIFYSKYGRGEGKNFNVVQYFWREYCIEHPGDVLILAGRFADDMIKINNPFEFHNGENFRYLGQIQDPLDMADIMRTCDVALLPYFADACSNTVLEAQACGLPVVYDHSGGTPELIDIGVPLFGDRRRYDIIRDAIEEKEKFDFEDFKLSWGLGRMGQEYDGLFKLLIADMSIES